MKHFLTIFAVVFITGCAKVPPTIKTTPKTTPFATDFLTLYQPETAKNIRLRIEAGEYSDLTLLIVLSPRQLQSGFDLQNCGDIGTAPNKPLEESRGNLCSYYLKFLRSIAKVHLEYSPYRFDKLLGQEEREILVGKKAIGAVYFKRTNKAVLVESLGRHNVYERMETWFLPFIEGLECNWAGLNVEQWAKPKTETPGHAGLANIDMTKEAVPIDSSLVAGYTFSDNYRYNILDTLPHLLLTIR